MASDSSNNYDLYINPYSICSIMVSYTTALRGEPKDSDSDMSITEHEVNIFHAEQLTEDFLTQVNPEGQVRQDRFSITLNQFGFLTPHTFD